MKIVAVIPVHGRFPLLKLTIQRLYQKNNIDHVICVGEEDNKDTCIKEGAEFIVHPNKPIGKKINLGFQRAKDIRADVVSFVGSSDWLSDNWFEKTVPHLATHGMVGKLDFNMAHINSEIKLARWDGYPIGSEREFEPIGIGRILSASFLDKIEWEPVDDLYNSSLDWSMMLKLIKAKECYCIYNSEDIQSLSVSCDSWVNMHKFEQLSFRSPVYLYLDDWLNTWFPEIYKL